MQSNNKSNSYGDEHGYGQGMKKIPKLGWLGSKKLLFFLWLLVGGCA
jgi:hypothetical protein